MQALRVQRLPRGIAHRQVALLVPAGLPFVVYLLPMLSVPFESDEAAYGVVARVILDGGLPYRDVFDHKPPLVYVWYAVSFLLFGEAHGPRIAAALAISGTALAVTGIVTQLLDRRRGLWAGSLFALSTGALLLHIQANTEVFAILPMSAALLAVLRGRSGGRLRWYAAGGALSAAAVLTKSNLILPVAGMALVLAVQGLRTRDARVPAAYVAAGLAVLPVVLAPFAFAGALGDFLYANVTYQLHYFAEPDVARDVYWRNELPLVLRGIGPLLGLAALQAAWHARLPRSVDAWLALAWAVGLVLAVIVPGRFYEHYAYLLIPVVAIACCLGPLPRPLRNPAGLGLIAAVLAYAVLMNAEHLNVLSGPENRDGRLAWIGRAIARETRDGDQVWEFGRATVVQYYSGRSSPTRWIYDRPFRASDEALEEAMRALRASPPAFIVDTRLDRRAPYPEELSRLIEERYVPVGSVTDVTIYRRRGPPAAPASVRVASAAGAPARDAGDLPANRQFEASGEVSDRPS